MAATLIYIKSRMLLPPEPVEGCGLEDTDPRRELVEQLIEHEKFRRAAGLLHDREVVELSVWTRGDDEFEAAEREAVSANVYDLVKAFHRVVERFKENIVVRVANESVTLEEKVAELRGLLALQAEVLFSFFLQRPISRLHLVVTFFALLEMARLGEIQLSQDGLFEDIRIIAC